MRIEEEIEVVKTNHRLFLMENAEAILHDALEQQVEHTVSVSQQACCNRQNRCLAEPARWNKDEAWPLALTRTD